ncbi:hypothetical protein [Gorillibacterium sp. CAU 1737]|uniref:hypothetical protein n=1 Tax=Gorillibacterium sp. CAU 1737 TaxID=3140362 RepID=UPI00326144EF
MADDKFENSIEASAAGKEQEDALDNGAGYRNGTAFGEPLLGGSSPNDTVNPAWNAVYGEDLRSSSEAGNREEVLPEEPVGPIDLAAVPDADEIAPGSPVDPAAPLTEVVNGIDLLNGTGADDPDDDFRRVDNREPLKP